MIYPVLKFVVKTYYEFWHQEIQKLTKIYSYNINLINMQRKEPHVIQMTVFHLEL